ncbi:putative camp-specific 3',5'-cyclic phosphodiesterase [Cercophora samala]|uniref:Phosphodiesterase n=1 Tax=Cercophora samala TaxID=330535 RepID=A0AA40DEY8_9PEZI|nr:putative camp-specific 3',5'-cyclic phosphodiesterase [Cercophora samala]
MEDSMESAKCNVIYVDRAVSKDRHVQSSSGSFGSGAAAGEWEFGLQENIGLLLSAFERVFLCGTGGACLDHWRMLYSEPATKFRPTIIFLDIPAREPISSKEQWELEPSGSELYGLALLERIDTASRANSMSSLVIVVPMITRQGSLLSIDTESFRRLRLSLVDLGATDAALSPLSHSCLDDIRIHARRACRHATSLHGTNNLVGETMISRLLPDLCISVRAGERCGNSKEFCIPAEREALVSHAIAQFQFDAPKFSHEELMVAASLIFEHAFSAPELAPWRLEKEQLQVFIVACWTAYKKDVAYHNFCHVVDVLQHIFHTLVRIGALPPYPPAAGSTSRPPSNSEFAQCIEPHIALTLLVTAIGHDVGHPGVNNGFLVKTNDPLARLYSDRSVLESYHCAAFTDILRKYWPQVYNCSKMRKLVIDSILATDMGVHDNYMAQMRSVLDKIRKAREEQRALEAGQAGMDRNHSPFHMDVEPKQTLICALLIKCADISNVARRYDTAVKWMHTLAEETAGQREKERLKNVPTSVHSLPGTDQLTLASNQLFFMNNFAAPLFVGVATLIPELQFCVKAIEENKVKFEAILKNVDEHENSPSQMDFANAQRPNSSQHSVKPAAGRSNPPEINGINTSFDLADDDSHSHYAPKQRCSETTEVSSAPDSAGTGKMPLSPSTQGTSIVSINSSVDPPASCAVTSSTPDSFRNHGKGSFQHQVSSDNGYVNGHTNRGGSDTQSGLDPGGQLKKKPSFIQKTWDKLIRKGSSP